MKSIFEKESYIEIVKRLDKLTKHHVPQWGKMNVEQMLVHCRKTVELAMGDNTIEAKHPLISIIATLFKESLYDDKPFKKNLRTFRDFRIKTHDTFEVEHKKLKRILYRMHNSEKFFFPYTAHPVYGRLEPYMWGQYIYKHLDHHLTQFGI
jgi:hypothetical protein